VVEGVSSGRLAELTVAFSLATDLGFGQPMEPSWPGRDQR
jgi:hypothetical protein